ncbi:hypothetical protein [Clostridium butyricum]|uniref:hypothetical protein n=1 Tax=Clostridium butyricum TaxID=1492 RepID=UPI00189C88D2|nr:hypothetical protein [Clostridium butyricum]MDB2151196.1 hypothetical protein [Clostridium butyricum]MDU3584103.1 hypothetical protein [Clostridium butyricum]MDU3595598.1 hypothetical protein [Clostridium butyricum]
MILAEKITYLKKEMGIEYSFIGRKIGATPNRLWRFALPRDNKHYRNLNADQLKALE